MVTEAEWDYLRQDRNSALRVIDKYQLTLVYKDLTSSQKTELATYRTALLQLPQTFDTPEDCYANFPTKPSWI